MPVTRQRLASIDSYRGLVMLLMFGEVLQTCAVASALPASAFWQFVCEQQSHAEWVGCHLHDLIQPGFTFLVGVSIPLSIATRRRHGDAVGRMLLHAARRAAILIGLGILVLSMHPRTMLWKFEDTLTQIGLGYAFVFALALGKPRLWGMALAAILLGEWILFAAYPAPGAGFDYASVGVTPDWLQRHGLSGWQAHWQKNANVAFAFDSWFLELFPGNAPYIAPKGLTTLNFIPTMATMILGLMAGRALMAEGAGHARLRRLVFAGLACLAAGGVLHVTGVSPIVKSLWTPSWVLFSGGWCFLFMAAFHWVADLKGQDRLMFPLIVIGSNSLAAYLIDNVFRAFTWGSLRRVFGAAAFEVFGPAYQPFVYGIAVMLLFWLVLYGMHRAGWHLRL
jgi:predicted acyltransferase